MWGGDSSRIFKKGFGYGFNVDEKGIKMTMHDNVEVFLDTPLVTINYKTSHANGRVTLCLSYMCKLFQTQHTVFKSNQL